MSLTLHTTHGDLKLELLTEIAPVACENFLALAAAGEYDGTLFHRLIPKFIIQGGSTTSGGGQSIWGSHFRDEVKVTCKHDRRGLVSMANSGPDTNASQFFITLAKAPSLDMKYTLFAKVIDGDATLEAMENVRSDAKFRPLYSIKLEKITIHANPIAEKASQS